MLARQLVRVLVRRPRRRAGAQAAGYSSKRIQLAESAESMREVRQQIGEAGKTIGFVPTMGALHEGHLKLARTAAEECDEVVASIFVNPTQFSKGEDLEKYPRDIVGDLKKLQSIPKVTTVFAPPAEEMYPPGDNMAVTAGGFGNVLRESKGRPGHFDGVVTIVSKLFNIVKPHKAYFGQKDGAQCMVVKRLVRDMMYDTEIVIVPTVREPNGLAMSSRNRYLSPEEHSHATAIYRALTAVERAYTHGERDAKTLLSRGREVLETNDAVEMEYLDITSVDTAREILDGDVGDQDLMVSVAAKVGSTRLIDNVLLPPRGSTS